MDIRLYIPIMEDTRQEIIRLKQQTVMNTDIHLPYQVDLHLQQIPTELLQIPDRIHILSGNSVSMQGVLHG